MIMNASSLPTKEVLSNIDKMWIEEMIESLVEWNMENLEPETVKKLLGDKHAQVWDAIKKFGKTNFMEWFATGSSTFMQKEVLMHKLQGFLQIVGSNDRFAQCVDDREMLEQVWDAGQIGKESPIYDEETMKQRSQDGPMQHAQQAIQEVEQKASELIKQAQEQARDAKQEAKDAKNMEQFKIAEIAARERTEMFKLVRDINESNANFHLTEAQIDKTQAETVKILKEASVVASPELEAKASEAEEVEQKTEIPNDA
jgi:hypothetical protein